MVNAKLLWPLRREGYLVRHPCDMTFQFFANPHQNKILTESTERRPCMLLPLYNPSHGVSPVVLDGCVEFLKSVILFQLSRTEKVKKKSKSMSFFICHKLRYINNYCAWICESKWSGSPHHPLESSSSLLHDKHCPGFSPISL